MILFFGPPGSGKSVQGDLLVKRNNWHWLSTGQLFRESKDPELLKRLSSGELIDDNLTNKVLNDALEKIKGDMKVVVDGYPRNTAQAEWLVSRLPALGREISCVIEFDVSKEEIIRRLSERGRAEDEPAVIERRLTIYREKTKPVLDFFAGRGITPLKVDGIGTVDEVHERLQQVVDQCLQK